ETLLRSRRSATRSLAERLCAGGHVTVLASDGHRAGAPRPVDALARGAEAAPDSIVSGGAPPAPPEVRPRGGAWRRRARAGVLGPAGPSDADPPGPPGPPRGRNHTGPPDPAPSGRSAPPPR